MKSAVVLSSVLAVMLMACHGRTADDDTQLDAYASPLPAYQPVSLVIDQNESATGPVESRPQASGLALAETNVAYYVVMFGYQGRGLLNLPRHTHTYALFVRAVGADPETAALSSFSISWLPQDGVVAAGQPVKPGRLYSFAETTAIAQSNSYDIRRSYVVRIHPSLYDQAVSRFFVLDAGSANGNTRYKMIDDMTGRIRIADGQPAGYTNCIHAVSDTLRYANGTLLETGLKHGFAASDSVYNFMSGYFVGAINAKDQVIAARLGL